MTTQEIIPKEEDTQSAIKCENETPTPPQEMNPPLITKVAKSGKDWSKLYKPNRLYSCNGCNKTYTLSYSLRHHIRRYHCNLDAETTSYEMKEINQVWIESVLNTNELMEIKKIGHNTLIMQKFDTKEAEETHDLDPGIDLSYADNMSKTGCRSRYWSFHM